MDAENYAASKTGTNLSLPALAFSLHIFNMPALLLLYYINGMSLKYFGCNSYYTLATVCLHPTLVLRFSHLCLHPLLLLYDNWLHWKHFVYMQQCCIHVNCMPASNIFEQFAIHFGFAFCITSNTTHCATKPAWILASIGWRDFNLDVIQNWRIWIVCYPAHANQIRRCTIMNI